MTKPVWWIVVNQNGRGNIEPCDAARSDFENREEAEAGAREADKLYPELAPHRALLVSELNLRKGRRKLSDDDVRAIRERHAAGESYTVLAECFEVCPSNIQSIATRRTWRHVA